MKLGYFVTGTGTDVGKTYVTTALARHFTSRGHKVFAFKPIETGCLRVDGHLVGADQQKLCEAAANWQTGTLRGVYQFEPPVAPSMASSSVQLDAIVEVFRRGVEQSDVVLVEGAGGWRVPITRTEDMAALAAKLELPVLVVAQAGLGTINHSLLTIEAVEKTQRVAWLVLSQRPTDDADLVRNNVIAIAERWSPRVIVLDDRFGYGVTEAKSAATVPRETVLDRVMNDGRRST